MASKIKSAAVGAASKVSKPSSSPQHQQPIRSISDIQSAKYLLRVSAGPFYDESTHQPVLVNSTTPTCFENDFVKVKLHVRIRNYSGLPLHAPSTSAYFEHASRTHEQYSIGFSFVPKRDLAGAHAIWGNDFDHPVRDRLPPGFSIAVRIVKEFVDPSIELDAYADRPWLLAPALTSFFALGIGEQRESADAWGAPEDLPFAAEDEPVVEGQDGDGGETRERLGMPDAVNKRKKFYRSSENREAFVFEKGRLYQADFFNPYIDFSNFSLKLPGFSINCIRYVNDKTHKLRYVFKNSETGDLYMCAVLTLLHGEDLKAAVKDEEARWAKAKDTVDGESSTEGFRTSSDTPRSGSEASWRSAEDISKVQLPEAKPPTEVEKAYVDQNNLS